jgi:hypothetical protein
MIDRIIWFTLAACVLFEPLTTWGVHLMNIQIVFCVALALLGARWIVRIDERRTATKWWDKLT